MLYGTARKSSFYFCMSFFILFVLFLYGPMLAIMTLSFQGPTGGLTFPMNGISLHWFTELFREQRVGDFKGSFTRSVVLATIVMVLTVTISLSAGMAFRKKFWSSNLLFYLTISSLIIPSILLTLGIGLLFDRLGMRHIGTQPGLEHISPGRYRLACLSCLLFLTVSTNPTRRLVAI